jgi:hypothetical protein
MLEHPHHPICYRKTKCWKLWHFEWQPVQIQGHPRCQSAFSGLSKSLDINLSTIHTYTIYLPQSTLSVNLPISSLAQPGQTRSLIDLEMPQETRSRGGPWERQINDAARKALESSSTTYD